MGSAHEPAAGGRRSGREGLSPGPVRSAWRSGCALRRDVVHLERGRTLAWSASPIRQVDCGPVARARPSDRGTVRLVVTTCWPHRGSTGCTPRRRRGADGLPGPNTPLDPTWTVRDIVTEPLRLDGVRPGPARRPCAGAPDLVGLGPAFAQRYPHELWRAAAMDRAAWALA
ncbi:hypothetical protein HBB16_00845 [Pseudonocardia sp. MCCB 268]|nr:hypothetical protein [Pseudonocardia cytotoxica]